MLCLSLVVAATMLGASAAALDVDLDAGADDDAGAPSVGEADLTNRARGDAISAEPIVTLPPATPDPQIAPIVDEPAASLEKT